jgi:hypothetical protein
MVVDGIGAGERAEIERDLLGKSLVLQRPFATDHDAGRSACPLPCPASWSACGTAKLVDEAQALGSTGAQRLDGALRRASGCAFSPLWSRSSSASSRFCLRLLTAERRHANTQ